MIYAVPGQTGRIQYVRRGWADGHESDEHAPYAMPYYPMGATN